MVSNLLPIEVNCVNNVHCSHTTLLFHRLEFVEDSLTQIFYNVLYVQKGVTNMRCDKQIVYLVEIEIHCSYYKKNWVEVNIYTDAHLANGAL